MRCKIEFGNPLVEWARVQAPAVCNQRPRALSKRHHGDDGRGGEQIISHAPVGAAPIDVQGRPTELHSAGKGGKLFMQLARVCLKSNLM
jgi:hypothetical protein